jgi:hypothetical protein
VQLVWQANQPGASGEADLGGGAVRLLVRRRQGEVAIEPLSAGEFEMLAGFARGRALAQALAAASGVQPDCDLGRVLAQRIGDATIVDFLRDENVRSGRQAREIRRPYCSPDSR